MLAIPVLPVKWKAPPIKCLKQIKLRIAIKIRLYIIKESIILNLIPYEVLLKYIKTKTKPKDSTVEVNLTSNVLGIRKFTFRDADKILRTTVNQINVASDYFVSFGFYKKKKPQGLHQE